MTLALLPLALLAAQATNEPWPDGGIINFFVPPYSDVQLRAGLEDKEVVGVERYIEWCFLEPEEGQFRWEELDRVIDLWSAHGKFTDLRITTANNMPHDSPSWLFEQHNVRCIVDWAWCDFDEGVVAPWELVSGEVAGGALQGAATAGTETVLVRTQPGSGKLVPGKKVSLQVDVLDASGGSLFIRAVPADGSDAVESEAALEPGTRTLTLRLGDAEEQVLEVGLRGGATATLDNLNFCLPDHDWIKFTGNVAGFPNYFDPVFREKWENLLRAVADRYGDDPRVRTISVGGHGRWEEIMLDPDIQGSLDDQWMAMGYTNDRYIDHLKWAIAKTKEHFPKKEWRIQLAFGLATQIPKEFIYRRIAAYAFREGIELKQNGMGDHYGTFGEDTHATYTFNRLRHDPAAKLIYETGGQMYNNNFWMAEGLAGHPISCLNRILIDGADFIYLYDPDIRTQGVNRYFHYTVEQIGRPLFTTFYNWLGDHSMSHDTWPNGEVEYENVWLGIRNHRSSSTDWPRLARVEGERVASTRHSASRMVFDIDDRQAYSGFYGATFHIDHLDQGELPIRLSGWDGWNGRWVGALGEIPRTKSGEWELDSFYLGNHVYRVQGSGADSQSDIVLSDNRRGYIAARTVEVTGVPALPWQTREISAIKVTDKVIKLASGDEITLDIPLPEFEAAAFIDLTLFAGPPTPEHPRLYALVEDDAGNRVAEKEYYYPSDGDTFRIPVANVPRASSYRVTVRGAVGDVGLYAGENDEPAWRLLAYEYESEDVAPWQKRQVPASRDDWTAYEIEFLRPTFGLVLGTFGGEARLVKLLPTTREEVSEVVVWEGVVETSEMAMGGAGFEPQAPGRYRFEIEGIAGVGLTCELIRLEPPRAARPWRPGTSVVTIDPEDFGLHNLATLDDGKLHITDLRPHVDAPLPEPLAADASHWIEFSLRNETGSGMARLWWAREGEDFRAEDTVLVPVVPNDTETRDYAFPMRQEEGWRGSIARVRLQPVTGSTEVGLLEVSRLAITSEE